MLSEPSIKLGLFANGSKRQMLCVCASACPCVFIAMMSSFGSTLRSLLHTPCPSDYRQREWSAKPKREPGNVSHPPLSDVDECHRRSCTVHWKEEPKPRGWHQTRAASPLCYSISLAVRHRDKQALIENACKQQQQPPSEVINVTPDFLTTGQNSGSGGVLRHPDTLGFGTCPSLCAGLLNAATSCQVWALLKTADCYSGKSFTATKL